MSTAGEEKIRQALEAAEEVRDPLEGLVERAKADPGVAFTTDVMARLADLKAEDRPAYEALRSQLKKAGVRVAELENAMVVVPEENSAFGPLAIHPHPLIGIVSELELFHTPDGTPYADIDVNGHRETWAIESNAFRQLIWRQFYHATGEVPSTETWKSARDLAMAQARYDGPERTVHVRVASHEGSLYLDLGDEAWRAVEVTPTSWHLISRPPVRFRRPTGYLAIPEPQRGGSIERLRRYLNIAGEDDFVLAVAWLLGALRGQGPYPVLVLSGEQGSAKSTLTRLLKAIVDPSTVTLRSGPHDERDLFIAATHSHLIAFDNLSTVPAWLSDALCRLATGGGFATRQLYSDQDQLLLSEVRPVILNGIENVVARPDLADRSLFLSLLPIPDDQRRSEAEIQATFQGDLPLIIGSLLDGLAAGLRNLPEVRLARLPRMADFSVWATACETRYWGRGRFMAAYESSRLTAVDDVLEADPVASAIRRLMSGEPEWAGNATELLRSLARITEDAMRRSQSWPSTPALLSQRLSRAAPFLRKVGIEIENRREGHNRTRMIRLARRSPDPAPPVDANPKGPTDVCDQSALTAKAGDATDAKPGHPPSP